MDGKELLKNLLNESREVIQIGGLRFTGVSEEAIKRIFAEHGIEYEPPF